MSVNGKPGAYLQPLRFGQNEQGVYSIEIYRGTRAEMRNKIPFIVAAGGWYDYTESVTGGADEIVARYPLAFGQAEQPVNDWEIFAQEVEKDILETDTPVVLTLTIDDKKRILDALNNPNGPSPNLSSSNATALYLEMLAGFRAKRVLVPTLRHTMTVSQVYTIADSSSGAGTIITTGTLITNIAIPQTIVNQMPNPSVVVVFADTTVKNYGWLYKRPTVRTSLFARQQLVQEWEFGLWSVLGYGAAQ